jgi:hypothetical protein
MVMKRRGLGKHLIWFHSAGAIEGLQLVLDLVNFESKESHTVEMVHFYKGWYFCWFEFDHLGDWIGYVTNSKIAHPAHVRVMGTDKEFQGK